MKNFKKIMAMMLALLMMFSLVACGEKKTDEPEKTPDATVSDVVENTESDVTTDVEGEGDEEKSPAEIAQEFEDEQLGSNSVLFREKVGKNFGAVKSGENFGSHFDETGLYAEMSFDDSTNGNYVMARMMMGSEDVDIFGDVALDWRAATEETIHGDVTGKVLKTTIDEGAIVAARWVDTNHKMVYGIVVLGENLEIADYVEQLFYSES